MCGCVCCACQGGWDKRTARSSQSADYTDSIGFEDAFFFGAPLLSCWTIHGPNRRIEVYEVEPSSYQLTKVDLREALGRVDVTLGLTEEADAHRTVCVCVFFLWPFSPTVVCFLSHMDALADPHVASPDGTHSENILFS